MAEFAPGARVTARPQTFGTSAHRVPLGEMRKTADVALEQRIISEETHAKLHKIVDGEELASEDVRIVRQLLIDFCPVDGEHGNAGSKLGGEALERFDRIVAHARAASFVTGYITGRQPAPVGEHLTTEQLVARLREVLEALYERGWRLTTSGTDIVRRMAVVRLDDVKQRLPVWP